MIPKLPGSDLDDEPYKFETKKPKLTLGYGKSSGNSLSKPKRPKIVFSIGKKVYKPSDFKNKPKPALPSLVDKPEQIYLETLKKLECVKEIRPTS